MNFRILKKILLIVCVLSISIAVVGCKKKKTAKYNNETDALVFSISEVDKVFNPFFTTSGTDGEVVGMTQIGMLSNDKDGNPTYGDNEVAVTKDLELVTKGTPRVDQTTTYYFVLKNNVKFSNGSALTIKDVLFNLYVYLDPVYTGSSTIYSTDIIGLKEYRTQEIDENEQEAFKQRFETIAETRIDALAEASSEILLELKNEVVTDEIFRTHLQEYATKSELYENVVKDYLKAYELFGEELEQDFNNSMDTYKDMNFTDSNNKVYENLFTTNVEVFLYNEGYISWNKKEGKLYSSLVNDVTALKTWTKERAINTIFIDKIPNQIEEVVRYWNTSALLYDYLVNEAMEEYFKDGSDRKIKNISGIVFENKTKTVSVNGASYGVPTYNEDGSVKEGNEVLSITIKDVDPKAIWNFSLGIAPMYYYSDEERINKFDYEANFGVEYASQTFMNGVVKNPAKIGVPVGAGAYAASKSSGGITNVAAGDFYDKGVIYYERNPYFIMGPAKINKVRYQVVAASQMLNTLYNNEVDFVTPNAKPETIEEISNKDGINSTNITTAGYGYIGINAGKVPDIEVRQAIMHAINTQEAVDYYKAYATPLYRGMSSASWAYPDGSTPYYPYIGGQVPEDLSVVNPAYRDYVTSLGKKAKDKLTEQEQQDFIKGLVESAGYTIDANGLYTKGDHTLKYTFTIAGELTDHPAWQAMFHAGEILNELGFQINVTTDANALKKLSTGALTVWAAAWGSTIDPDMYQVFHKNSNATSVLNWGYKQILQNTGGKYDLELSLIEELSELIEQGRQTNAQVERKAIYSRALDIVMQLAIELPTYQRKDLFAYNIEKINESTLTPEDQLSPYKGLTSNLYNVSLRVK